MKDPQLCDIRSTCTGGTCTPKVVHDPRNAAPELVVTFTRTSSKQGDPSVTFDAPDGWEFHGCFLGIYDMPRGADVDFNPRDGSRLTFTFIGLKPGASATVAAGLEPKNQLAHVEP